MAINQLSSSNTFQQWLIATQVLIEQSNFYMDRTNAVFDVANTIDDLIIDANSAISNAASNTINTFNETVNSLTSNTVNVYNNTVIVFNNTSNVYSNTINVYNEIVILNTNASLANTNSNAANTNSWLAYTNSLNTFNSIQSYVSTAFDAANSILIIANSASSTANAAANTANAAAIQANDAYNLAVSATGQVIPSQSANTNKFLTTNGTYLLWSNSLITVTNDTTTNNNQRYLTFVEKTNTINEVLISDTNLYYNPSTGQLNAVNFNSLSDVTYKEDIVEISNPTSIISQLNGISFKWKNNDKRSFGLIAQDLEKVIPELVSGNHQKTINYDGLIPFLIESIKELKKEIENLKNNK